MEKQKTCITIVKPVLAGTTIKEAIQIPHNVDMIRVTSLGFIMIDGAGFANTAFFVTSDIVTNIHDQILGVAGNISYDYNNSKMKEFHFPTKTINGTHYFNILDLKTLNPNTFNGSLHIDLEFIELDKSSKS